MTRVPVRELNQDTAGVLARVKDGEEVEITERGAVIARLVPAQPSPVADLVAAGKLRPAKLTGPIPAPKGPVRTDQEAGELLRRLRDDERY
ncbi:type II toxin-antitoxin system Phd/YefM family antitoxin [Amycolatopsis pithecellobii]|uniref:Type II toxin-antitoxin system prevent-host-death family antitoxin n=1 Tax=Amycolatopsis pithecellobii TaxID=664692 RepID=A0A6N7YX78_9PSEU|nr:type II toxin-antitoxin system prevent-host-death family antitoxin [Amycolatopsis pithecellobii]MTD57675.1 type II toxin-antitoxin system prevent-host-death family antitoxin [Amycolatopsis pithecellobii]